MHISVTNWVRALRNGSHTPTQHFWEYPTRHPPSPHPNPLPPFARYFCWFVCKSWSWPARCKYRQISAPAHCSTTQYSFATLSVWTSISVIPARREIPSMHFCSCEISLSFYNAPPAVLKLFICKSFKGQTLLLFQPILFSSKLTELRKFLLSSQHQSLKLKIMVH